MSSSISEDSGNGAVDSAVIRQHEFRPHVTNACGCYYLDELHVDVFSVFFLGHWSFSYALLFGDYGIGSVSGLDELKSGVKHIDSADENTAWAVVAESDGEKLISELLRTTRSRNGDLIFPCDDNGV